MHSAAANGWWKKHFRYGFGRVIQFHLLSIYTPNQQLSCTFSPESSSYKLKVLTVTVELQTPGRGATQHKTFSITINQTYTIKPLVYQLKNSAS
jgi:hypothetical protein